MDRSSPSEKEGGESMMQQRKTDAIHICVSVALIFILFLGIMLFAEKAKAATGISGVNATLMLMDDGDAIRGTDGNITVGFEVNVVYNDTSNVYFYANYTNGTGQSVVNSTGTTCAIEFAVDAGGNSGPFAMAENITLNLFEYNRSFPRNGTFGWNVTCANANIGTASMSARDSVRIFGPGCSIPAVAGTIITNNTIFCSGTYDFPATGIGGIELANENITLDCNQSRIISSSANAHAAVNISRNGSIVKNCIFETFKTGVYVTAPAQITSALLFNNTFFNMSVTGINITSAQNITIRENNFTTDAVSQSANAVAAKDVAMINLSKNIFANNLSKPIVSFINVTTNATDNNTLGIKLVAPANNTDNRDINFTFTIPSLGLDRTCDIMIGSTPSNSSGRRVISSETENNVTLNRSFVPVERYDWYINCTDINNNGAVSSIFNTTNRACSVPTSELATKAFNITLCPGTYVLNGSISHLQITAPAASITCNNTQLFGNGLGNAIAISANVTDSGVKHCYIERFGVGIVANITGVNNISIVNNTLRNMTSEGIQFKRMNGINITNNTFFEAELGILSGNSYNISIDNNLFFNLTKGIQIKNTSASNIRNNNFTNISSTGIEFSNLVPATNRTTFDSSVALVTGNSLCGVMGQAFGFIDYVMDSTLNGIISVNTFCNATDAFPNVDTGKVMWTTDVLVQDNNGVISGSLVNAVNILGQIGSSTTFTNASGLIRLVLPEFNISNNNLVTYLTPHNVIGNLTPNTKTLRVIINESRVVDLGNNIILNLSNPDAIPARAGKSAERQAAAKAGASTKAASLVKINKEENKEDNKEEEREEKEEEIAEETVYKYNLLLSGVLLGEQRIYDKGIFIDTPVFKDYESYKLIFVVENNETGNVSDMVFSLTVPESINVISKEVNKDILEENESATITFMLETEDILESFNIQFNVLSNSNEKINISFIMHAILEGGKGKLYYTRQKIIEETREVIIRTYKILFLLFLVPILLLLRATTIVDENALRRMIDDKKITNYWRVYVPEQSYLKYNMFQNLKPIHLEEDEVIKANQLVREGKISYALATMILYANKRLIPRVFTFEKVPDEVRHKYPRVYFTSPLRDYREEQLQRYVEMQKKKGYKSNEIREALLVAKWDGAIIKKYINPEEDLAQYIALQQKQGKTQGEIRKELLDVRWDKAVVDKYIPREEVLKEYIAAQRKTGKTNEQLRRELTKVGWEKELITKYLNPENDLKAYIVGQQHKGLNDEQIQQNLIKGKWKKEIVDKMFIEMKKKK